MQNLKNLAVFEILITQNLLKCLKDPFVRSALKLFFFRFAKTWKTIVSTKKHVAELANLIARSRLI